MPVYPGDPAAELNQVLSFPKDGMAASEVKTGMHVGTHMDAPLHMVDGGKKISEISVERFFGRGVLIDARDKKINKDLLKDVDIRSGDFILVLTGFGSRFNDPDYYENYPDLEEDFAQELVKLKVGVVGMDTPSPDKPPFNVHKILMNSEILIIENLTNLESLLGVKEFEVLALPAKFDAEAALARVVAKIK